MAAPCCIRRVTSPPTHPPTRTLQTFREMDLTRDGVINPEEWLALVHRNPDVISFMTLPVLTQVGLSGWRLGGWGEGHGGGEVMSFMTLPVVIHVRLDEITRCWQE